MASSMFALILGVFIIIAIGLMVLGYFLAGRWWKGGAQWAMGFLFGFLFILAAIGICVGGCTILVFTQ